MGRSEQRKDFWGDEYTAHLDDDGNEVGRSEEKTDFFGDKYTQHYNNDGDEIGRSEERTDFFNDPYTQHYDRDGDKAGHSEPQKDFSGVIVIRPILMPRAIRQRVGPARPGRITRPPWRGFILFLRVHLGINIRRRRIGWNDVQFTGKLYWPRLGRRPCCYCRTCCTCQ